MKRPVCQTMSEKIVTYDIGQSENCQLIFLITKKQNIVYGVSMLDLVRINMKAYHTLNSVVSSNKTNVNFYFSEQLSKHFEIW